MSKNREDYWHYTDEEADAMIINLGDEYYKDGAWHIVTSVKEQMEVMRKRYPH
jgi:hypothetical protein